jgi:hypothetical protein
VTAQSQPPRLLHRKLEHGYTQVPALAAPREPEAVTAAEQQRQSEDSHARHDGQLRAVVIRMQNDLAILRSSRDRRFRSEFRSIQQSLEGIRRCL